MNHKFVYTKNPLILWYASARYAIGSRLEHLMWNRDALQKGIWRPLWRWAMDSEGRYNCLIEPNLGKVIKWEAKKMKATTKLAAANRAGKHDLVQKYLKRSHKYEDRMDVYQKLRYPDHQSRLERKAIDDEILARTLAKYQKKD